MTSQLTKPPTHSFALFWHANRANEHEKQRVLGLLDKHLSQDPDDAAADFFKACVLLQMSQELHDDDMRRRYISVALDIIKNGRNAIMPKRRFSARLWRKIEFSIGISLAQLRVDARQDAQSAAVLQHVIGSGRLVAEFSKNQQQEAYVALSVVCQSSGATTESRDAFEAAKSFGLDSAIALFEDYVSRSLGG